MSSDSKLTELDANADAGERSNRRSSRATANANYNDAVDHFNVERALAETDLKAAADVAAAKRKAAGKKGGGGGRQRAKKSAAVKREAEEAELSDDDYAQPSEDSSSSEEGSYASDASDAKPAAKKRNVAVKKGGAKGKKGEDAGVGKPAKKAKKFTRGSEDHREHCQDIAIGRIEAGTNPVVNLNVKKLAELGGGVMKRVFLLAAKGDYKEDGALLRVLLDELDMLIGFAKEFDANGNPNFVRLSDSTTFEELLANPETFLKCYDLFIRNAFSNLARCEAYLAIEPGQVTVKKGTRTRAKKGDKNTEVIEMDGAALKRNLDHFTKWVQVKPLKVDGVTPYKNVPVGVAHVRWLRFEWDENKVLRWEREDEESDEEV